MGSNGPFLPDHGHPSAPVPLIDDHYPLTCKIHYPPCHEKSGAAAPLLMPAPTSPAPIPLHP